MRRKYRRIEAKQRVRERLTNAAVDLVDEFEQYMEQLHPTEYKRLRETFDHITDDKLGAASLDGVLIADGLTRFILDLFALKEKLILVDKSRLKKFSVYIKTPLKKLLLRLYWNRTE